MASWHELSAVLLDPQPLWLDAVDGVLRRMGIHAVRKTRSASDALAAVEQHQPDLLLLEPNAVNEGDDRLDVLRRARELAPGLKAVVVSESEDLADVEAAFAAGASAYVIKTAQEEDLAAAVRQAFEHSVYLLHNAVVLERPHVPGGGPDLTPREREILSLVSDGRSNGDVAKLLWITEQTVKFHLSNIYRKLEVDNRTQASRWAHAHGLSAATRT